MDKSTREYPGEWRCVPLGEIAMTRGGFGFPVNKQGKKFGDYPFFKVSDMNSPGNERFMRTSNNWIDTNVLKELKARTFPASATIFPKIGAALLTNKKRLLVQDSVIDNNVMAVVVNDQTECLPEFLYHWFLTVDLGIVASPGTVPSLTSGQIQKVFVPLPPIPEQLRITYVLATVQTAIEQQTRLIALTRELKSTLMHKLFTEGLHEEKQKETEIGLVPESWDVLPLGEVMDGTPKNGVYKPLEAYGTGVLILRINDFSNDGDIVTSASNRINADEIEITTYALQEDDIVTNRVNSLSHLGKTALVGMLTEPMLFESNMMKYRVDKTKVLPSYIMRLLNSPVGKLQIVSRAKRAVAQSSINQGSLKAILLPIPKFAVQEEIVNIIDTMIEKIEVHARKKTLLEELFRTLLHQLMTGQMRVNELDLGVFEMRAILQE